MAVGRNGSRMVSERSSADSHSHVSACSWLSVASLESNDARKSTSRPLTRSSPSKPPSVMLSVPSGNLRHLDAWYAKRAGAAAASRSAVWCIAGAASTAYGAAPASSGSGAIAGSASSADGLTMPWRRSTNCLNTVWSLGIACFFQKALQFACSFRKPMPPGIFDARHAASSAPPSPPPPSGPSALASPTVTTSSAARATSSASAVAALPSDGTIGSNRSGSLTVPRRIRSSPSGASVPLTARGALASGAPIGDRRSGSPEPARRRESIGCRATHAASARVAVAPSASVSSAAPLACAASTSSVATTTCAVDGCSASGASLVMRRGAKRFSIDPSGRDAVSTRTGVSSTAARGATRTARRRTGGKKAAQCAISTTQQHAARCIWRTRNEHLVRQAAAAGAGLQGERYPTQGRAGD